MRALVFGATGMLGHKLAERLATRMETWGTVRNDAASWAACPPLRDVHLLGGVDARNLETVLGAFDAARPDVVVNAVAIVKQRPEAGDAALATRTNAIFPHQLAALARGRGARFVQLGTDCVFSGRRGRYRESDPPDPEDVYGRTKLLGEVDGPGCLTVRTSMVGRELASSLGLLEWLLARRGGRVSGYRRAVFSGFTTSAFSEVLLRLIEAPEPLSGLWHVAAEPITKLDLLERLNREGRLGLSIEPADEPVCDRSLDGSRFRAATGIVAPSWDEMIAGLFDDPTPYEEIRRIHAHG